MDQEPTDGDHIQRRKTWPALSMPTRTAARQRGTHLGQPRQSRLPKCKMQPGPGIWHTNPKRHARAVQRTHSQAPHHHRAPRKGRNQEHQQYNERQGNRSEPRPLSKKRTIVTTPPKTAPATYHVEKTQARTAGITAPKTRSTEPCHSSRGSATTTAPPTHNNSRKQQH